MLHKDDYINPLDDLAYQVKLSKEEVSLLKQSLQAMQKQYEEDRKNSTSLQSSIIEISRVLALVDEKLRGEQRTSGINDKLIERQVDLQIEKLRNEVTLIMSGIRTDLQVFSNRVDILNQQIQGDIAKIQTIDRNIEKRYDSLQSRYESVSKDVQDLKTRMTLLGTAAGAIVSLVIAFGETYIKKIIP